jgi:outer membrane protein TolC
MKSAVLLSISCFLLFGCRSASWHREKADRDARANISYAQQAVLGQTEDMATTPAADTLRARLLLDHDLPGLAPTNPPTADVQLPDPFILTPTTALQVAARNSRAFQQAKDQLFITALGLDLEQSAFRSAFASEWEIKMEENRDEDESVRGVTAATPLRAARTFQNGISWTGSLAVDLVKLLTQGSASSLGILADTGVSIPLLRGAGRDIAAEPLRQAERDMLYAVMEFERFKRTFAFDIFSGYLEVLQAASQIENALQNYESLTQARERARRLTDAGRLPAFQYDQTVQDELRARNRWIDAREQYASRLDRYKFDLGLPPDARVDLDDTILPELVESLLSQKNNTLGTYEDQGGQDISTAIRIALDNRLDLQIARMRTEDAARRIRVAQDALRPELTLGASVRAGESRASLGAADRDNARLDLGQRRSNAFLNLDLALNRRRERAAYRRAFIALDTAHREAAQLEDRVKLEMREALRRVHQTREALRIQQQAAELATQRVHSTDMFLQAGRAQIRDVLEAREALVNARNALTSAAVNHRLALLRYQRDADLLQMSVDGILQEHTIDSTESVDSLERTNDNSPQEAQHEKS